MSLSVGMAFVRRKRSAERIGFAPAACICAARDAVICCSTDAIFASRSDERERCGETSRNQPIAAITSVKPIPIPAVAAGENLRFVTFTTPPLWRGRRRGS